jgi:hypothetical protein
LVAGVVTTTSMIPGWPKTESTIPERYMVAPIKVVDDHDRVLHSRRYVRQRVSRLLLRQPSHQVTDVKAATVIVMFAKSCALSADHGRNYIRWGTVPPAL